LTVTLLPLSGCLYRTHKVKAPEYSKAQLQQATAQQLIERINSQAAKIQTLSETVDIAASSGGAKKGKVTEFQEIRGYILLRKPTLHSCEEQVLCRQQGRHHAVKEHIREPSPAAHLGCAADQSY
jgi:hypothetical protein